MALITKEGFEPNHKEFGLHIRSEVARKPAVLIAEKIASRANARAPITVKKQGDRRRVHLKGSYRAGPDGNLRVGRNTRAIAVVESKVEEAVFREFGTEDQPASHILLNAAIGVVLTDLKGGANIRAHEEA